MGKCYCGELAEFDDFGGYGHYESTVKAMENNVQNGFMVKRSENSFEIIYTYLGCGSMWSIGKPDFPVTGWFKKLQDA